MKLRGLYIGHPKKVIDIRSAVLKFWKSIFLMEENFIVLFLQKCCLSRHLQFDMSEIKLMLFYEF